MVGESPRTLDTLLADDDPWDAVPLIGPLKDKGIGKQPENKGHQEPEELQQSKARAQPIKTDRLPTGIDMLDKNLNGGLPSGAMVYFSSSPDSSPELFLFEFTIPRKTFYVTTYKNPQFIIRDMERLEFDTSNIVFIDLHEGFYEKLLPDLSNKQVASKKLVQYLDEWLDSIIESDENNFTIIFDSFSFLLEMGLEEEVLKRLMDKIYDIINNYNSICYLLVINGVSNKSIDNRIQYWCDVILEIDLERKGDKIINKLILPKIRNMPPLTDYIKFRITDRITIDTSRDIA
jgi:KaiC/GvpD/RAD55 family RecA-like ATPase